MSFIPECEKCGSEEHDGLRSVCDNTERQNVLYVCNKCYKKKELEELDATDLMLLQHPQLWDNTLKTHYDICGYGADAPAEKKKYYLCFDCKEMTTLVKNKCCDGCNAKRRK